MTFSVDNKVGKRVQSRRIELGLTQRATECQGVSYSHISLIEAGYRVPSWEALQKLAAKLNTTAEWLAAGDRAGRREGKYSEEEEQILARIHCSGPGQLKKIGKFLDELENQ